MDVPTTSKAHITEKIAVELAVDTSRYTCGLGHAPINKYAATMRRCVEKMLMNHQYLFNGMMSRLHVNMDNVDVTFQKVVDEMLEAGDMNWGRVIAIYALAGKFAKHLVKQGSTDTTQVIHKVAEICGSVVGGKLRDWVEKEGGWEAFLKNFPEQDPVEKSVWRGLVLSVLGVGALATIVAARG